MQGLRETHALDFSSVHDLLALGAYALLCNPLLGVVQLAGLVFQLPDDFVLRVAVVAELHEVGLGPFGDEAHRGVVADGEGETLDIERLDSGVPVQGGEGLVGVELLDAQHLALVAVHQVEGGGVERAVLEHGQHFVALAELAEQQAVAFVVELLDVGVVPDLLAGDGAYALAAQADALYDVLADKVAAGCLALDGESGEVVFEAGLLELRLRAQLYAHGLGFAVVVGGEPYDLRAFQACGQIVFLVACDARHGKTLGVVDGGLALAVDYVVDGAGVAPVEHAHVDEVLAEEGLVGDFRDYVFAVFAYHDDFRHIGALADEFSAVVPLESYADEALGEVGAELGVVVDHAGGGYGLEAGQFGAAGEILAVLLLKALEPVDGEAVDVVDVVPDLLHLLFDGEDALVHGFHVEFGYLAHGLVHEAVDVFHHDRPAERPFVGLHRPQRILLLLVPAGLVLLENLVDAVLEVDALQRGVVPVALELVEADLQLVQEYVAGVVCAVFEDFVHGQELRLVVHNDAGVRGEVALAVRECIQRVYGLVGGHVAGQVDEDFDLVGGHILYLLDFYLALVLGFENGLYEVLGVFAVGDFGDGDGALVDFFDFGAHLHPAAPLALHILRAVGRAAGREVGVELERLAFEYGHGGVQEFVEVVRENLGGETHADAVGALGEQQREAHGELRGLVVAAVVGFHRRGHLGVEHHFLCEFAEARLDVTGSGVGVAGEDISPVTLAVHGEAFLSEGHEGAEDGLVAVRVELHSLSHDVGDFGVGAVVDAVHSVQNPALHGLEAVHDMGHGPVENDVGSIVQVPVLEHPGQFELAGVALQQTVEFAARLCVFCDLEVVVFDDFFGDKILFFHNSSLRSQSGVVLVCFPSSPGPPSRKCSGTPFSGRNLPYRYGPGCRFS